MTTRGTVCILNPVGAVVIPARKKQLGSRRRATILHCKEFRRYFPERDRNPMPQTTLKCADITEPSLSIRIWAQFDTVPEIRLRALYELMERQSKGEEGVLLTDEQPNIFLVVDSKGELCTVSVVCIEGGWVVDAEVHSSLKWGIGTRVFFRNA